MTAADRGHENKCPLQRDLDRNTIFLERDGFWWSAELNCWMISAPDAIAAVLRDHAFSVHSYNFSEVAGRLGISLPRHQALPAYLPLALEGEKHTALRRRFSEQISANTARALEIFEHTLVAGIGQHFNATPPTRFCAVKEIIQPSSRLANLAIAGLEGFSFDDLESVPIFFDKGISLRKRQQIEQLIEQLHVSLPEGFGDDEKYFKIAFLMLSMDTLVGSISKSFLTVVRRNPGVAMSAMDWDRDLPATALPMIERKALADTPLFGHEIKRGDRVRLFVDVNEFNRDRGSKYNELYFAAGAHRCPGMNYSRKIWTIFVRHMRQIERKLHIRDFSYRSNDSIFTLLDTLEVETYV